VDYDRGGLLDLVVVNYVDYDPSRPCQDGGGWRDFCGPGDFPGSVSRLYRNEGGKPPRFRDVTLESGLGTRPSAGLGVLPADFNNDGWPDLFVANDGRPNHLWIGRGDGTFAEEAAVRGLAHDGLGATAANMGVAAGDFDGDGRFDMFVTHLTEESHTLWVQDMPGFFLDRTRPSGAASTRSSPSCGTWATY